MSENKSTNLAKLHYEDVEDLMEELNASCAAEELHGLAAGQIVSAKSRLADNWLTTAADFMGVDSDIAPPAKNELIAIYRQLELALKDSDLSFCLLLPSDDQPIAIRAMALGRWCQGFLTGFGLAGVKREWLSEELKEALTDIAAISQVSTEEVESEENEQSFMSLSEYVRLIVLNVFVYMIEQSRYGQGRTDGGNDQLH